MGEFVSRKVQLKLKVKLLKSMSPMIVFRNSWVVKQKGA